MNNSSYSISLNDWNYSIASKLILNAVILMLYLVIGIIGNSIVIYVHIRRMKSNTDGSYFIPALAITDLLAGMSNTCFELSKILHSVTYTNDLLCKTLWFVTKSTASAASLLLVVIAFQRYLKICQPSGKQMTIGYKHIALVLVVLFSTLVSFPCFFFYGSRDVRHETGTLGKRCTSVRGPWTKTEPLVFKAVITFGIVLIIVSLIVLYSLIGCAVRKSSKFRNNATNKTTSYSTSQIATCSYTTEGTTVTTLAHNEHSQPSEIPYVGEASEMTKRKANRNQINGLRLSIIFMLISGIVILTFIPKVGLMIWESHHENFWIELSSSEMGIYGFLYTFYIVNNIANPFIYGFFDRKFRKELFHMVPCLRHRS